MCLKEQSLKINQLKLNLMAKQNNPIKRKELYDYLSQNKMTDLSFDQFSREYGLKDDNFNELFTYLNNNEMTTLTPNQFKEAYFGDVSDVKKKDDSDLSTQQTEKDSSTPPKINTVSLDSEDLKTTNDVTQPLDSSTVRNYRNWKESTKVTDEDLKTIEETIAKELEPDTFDKIGLAYNTVADSFMNFFNSDPVAGTGGLTGDLDLLPRDTNAYNYISEELDQAESELREKLKGSKPEDYNKILRQRAIEIKKEKLKKGLVEKKQRNFLNELPVEDRENLFDFSENSIIAKNEELSKSVESANLLQNEFKEKANTYFTEVKPLVDRKKEIESMTFIDEEWASTEEQRLSLKKEYEELTNQITGVLNDAKEEGVLFSINEGDVKIQASNEYQEDLKSIQEKIKNTDAEIGTLSEEMDLFNRSYNMFATAGAKTTAAGLNIIGGLADLQVMYDKEILGSITEDVPLVGNVVKFRAWATQKFSDKLNEWSEDLRGEVQKDFSITDADSFDDYLTYTLTTTGETLPYVAAATSNPLIGATIIGGSTTGNKYRQIQQEIEQGVEYNKAQIITSSLMTGVTEAGLGFLPTVSRLRGFSRVYKSAPKSVRDKAVRSTVKGAKKYLMPAASESIEEGGVQMLENFNDAVILRKENVNIFDNVTDPLVAGGLVGFLLPGFGAVTGMAGRSISTIKEKRALKKNAERVLEVEAELAKGGLSEESMDAYKSEIIDLTTKNRDIILSNAQNIKKATKDEFETLKVLDKNISSYRKEAKEIRENTEVDIKVKKKQLSDLKKLAEEDIKEKDEILKTLKDRDKAPQEIVEDEVVLEESETKENVTYARRDIGEGESVFLEIKNDNKKVVSKDVIPNEANIIEESDIDNSKKVTPDAKPEDFKEVKPKDKSKRIKEVKKSAKTAINSYKKNRGGKYIPQNGELVRSLQINPELLSENDLLEFEEYVNNVKGNRFNPIKSKPTTRKFAKIFNNQPSVEKEVSTKEDKKEVDAGLLSEFESKKKTSIENVAKDKITDFAFIKSITKDELKGFTNTDLEVLNNNIDIISEGGAITPRVRSIMNSVKADRNNKGIQQELDGVKYRNLLRDSYDAAVNSIKNDAENRMFRYAERNQLRDLDNILKGKKSGKLYKYMGMESVAKGFGSYSINKQKGEGVAALDIFNVKREKVLKVNLQASRSRVNKMKFNAKIYLIQLQKFYEINKNIDTKKRIRPEEYIKASEVYAKSNRDDRYRENLTYVQDIYRELPKKNDGSIDVEASIKSLKKDEKQVFDIIENFNNNKGKQMSIDVATMEGKTPEIFDYYVPLNVRTKEKVDLSSIIKEADSFLEGGAYFSELGSLIERTAGVNPLDFNYVENFSRNVDKIYRSYHMLPAIKEFNSTMNRALNNENIDENGRVFIEASKELFTKVFRNEFASSYYTSNSFAEKFAKRINEIGYYNQLADPMRAGVELTSNLSFAIINNPKELAYGLKNRTSKGARDSYEDLEFIARIGNSAQSSRIFVASTSLYKEVEAGELTSSKKEPGIGRLIKSVNSILLEAPDRAVAIPLWEGSFKTRFKELTGKALDVNRMKEDNIYYDSVIEPLNESVRYADEVLSQGFSSLNPFESTPFSQLNPEERANILKMFNKYMTRFQMAEFSSIVKSVDALAGKRGDMSRGRGARLLGATLFRMSAYNFGMQFAYGTVLDTIMGVFGLESEYDEEEDKEFGKMLYNEGMSLAANVFVMRRLGNLQKVLASTGIESLNVGFGVDVGLRDDNSYNFRDSLTYSIIPRDENGDLILSSYSILKSSTKLLGAYSSFANSSIGLIENASKTGEIPGVKSAKKFETRRKAKEKMPEFLTKFLLSTIRIPAPRLIRKALNYQQARSAANSSKRAESIKDIIKSVEQNTGKDINSDLFRSEDELNDIFK